MHRYAFETTDSGTLMGRQSGRDGKAQIGAYFDKVDVFTIQEVLARVSRKRGERVTMQTAVTEAMQEWCAREGVKLTSTAAKPEIDA
jgi:hypothetical protein